MDPLGRLAPASYEVPRYLLNDPLPAVLLYPPALFAPLTCGVPVEANRIPTLQLAGQDLERQRALSLSTQLLPMMRAACLLHKHWTSRAA